MINITIVVPIYNAEKYLDRCMQSILNQSFKNFEVILVDDGSNDGSKIICEKYKAIDKRVILLSKKNGGVSSARNSGIDLASGELIMFVDPDDYLEKDMLKRMYDIYEKYKCDVVICDFETNSRKRCNITCTPNKLIYRNDMMDDILLDVLKGENETYCWNKLYKMSLIKNNKIYFENYNIWEDAIFNYRVYMNCSKVYYLPEKLYNYMVNSTGLSSKYSKDKFDAANRMLDLKLSIVDTYSIEPKLILDEIYKCFIFDSIASIIQEYENKSKEERISIYQNILRSKNIYNAFNYKKQYIIRPYIYGNIEKNMRLNNIAGINRNVISYCYKQRIRNYLKIKLIR